MRRESGRSTRVLLWIALWLPPAHALGAQGAVAPAEPRYFEQRSGWQASWGADATLTLADGAGHSSDQVNDGTTPFDPLWLRLYGRAGYGERVELVADVFASDSHGPSLFGLYLVLQPTPAVGLRAGLIPLTVGSWQDRAQPQRQPLIHAPLMFQYLVDLRADSLPASLDGLLAQRGRGRATQHPAGRAGRGNALALAYEHCWDTGVEVFGRVGRLRYRAALSDGTPGSPATKVRARRDGLGLQGRLTLQLAAPLRLGASWARGPYLDGDVRPFLPAGRALSSYRQTLHGADWRWRQTHFELHGEWLRSRYDLPLRARGLGVDGYAAEVVLLPLEGWSLAARYSALRFERVTRSDGARLGWDADARRIETGVAYRLFGSHVALKAVYQRTTVELAPRRRDEVYALQLGFAR